MNIILFTRTKWDEPPRIRHQIAELLIENGNKVFFFEKPAFFGQKLLFSKHNEELHLLRGWYLFHSKLCFWSPVKKLNDFVVSLSIKNLTKCIPSEIDLIINFNFDYHFIRKIFPTIEIITLINDDFWSKALPYTSKSLKSNLKLTCEASNRVLSVSEPLNQVLSDYCVPELFLPWSNSNYVSPSYTKRNVLLFWGFINTRLNIKLILNLLEENVNSLYPVKLRFVGPMTNKFEKKYKNIIKKFDDVEFLSSRSIEELSFDDVLAAFIPYIDGNVTDDVTTLPNKALPLLSKGLPLLISGMPNFIEKKFVYRIDDNLKNYSWIFSTIAKDFHEIQIEIEKFVLENGSSKRYSLLIK